ncbi:MAG: hypothetical protein NC132_05480 [Corallococcus sp.]|nr:hypothetical protein [Corallococcus sp.]MCM1359988.1 hypothetical protein [Corallococcus sp.]MCM1395545.1 hypothetical protein [Corallococcus sp.]
MKNKLKKILCLALCLALVLTAVFTLVACDRELTEEEKELLRKELLSDVSLDMSCAEMSFSVIEPTGTSVQVYAAWETVAATDGADASINADLFIAEYDGSGLSATTSATVLLMRGTDVYGASTALDIAGNDKIAGIKNKMDTVIPNLEKKTLEEILQYISSQTGVDLSVLGGITLPDGNPTINASEIADVLKEYFTKFTVTENGYSIGFDFNKVIDRIWNAAYSVATIIDDNGDLSLGTLYADETFKAVAEQLPLTAAELETAVNQVVAQINDQLPAEQQISFTALVAEQDETLYDYLGRYLAIDIDETHTVGSMTVGDVLCMLFNTQEPPVLKDMLDQATVSVLPAIKQMAAMLKVEFNFTKDKKLDGIRIGVTGLLEISVKPLREANLIALS